MTEMWTRLKLDYYLIRLAQPKKKKKTHTLSLSHLYIAFGLDSRSISPKCTISSNFVRDGMNFCLLISFYLSCNLIFLFFSFFPFPNPNSSSHHILQWFLPKLVFILCITSHSGHIFTWCHIFQPKLTTNDVGVKV